MKLNREAAQHFRKAIELKPDFEQGMIDLAVSLETQGLTGDAIAIYRELLEANPQNSSVAHHLVQLMIQQQRLEEALALLWKMDASRQGGLETKRKIGLINLELERYDDAIAIFEDILEQEPEAHQIRYYIGNAYEEKGDADHAIEEYLKIPSASFNYFDAVGHIAFLYKEKEEPEKGIAFLKEVINLRPDRLEPYLFLSGLFDSLGRPDEGLQTLTSIEERFPSDPSLHFRIGVILDKLGRKQETIARMKQVLALTPDDPQALNYLGYTYAELGENLDEGLVLLIKAASLRPNDGFIQDSLGWVYFKLKRYDDAIRHLEKAYEIVDDDTTIMTHLADSYAAKRSYQSALELYRRVFKLDPENREVSDKIKKIKQEIGEK
jgi:tetratricopeptide (TPR) repeat protein